ncbi:hypothetical protein BC828DRAFT_384111 [Blastocladiella britannica]|nr:hypothetical protein BC828DRAFT_384111 [Blastocladiella britannica]
MNEKKKKNRRDGRPASPSMDRATSPRSPSASRNAPATALLSSVTHYGAGDTAVQTTTGSDSSAQGTSTMSDGRGNSLRGRKSWGVSGINTAPAQFASEQIQEQFQQQQQQQQPASATGSKSPKLRGPQLKISTGGSPVDQQPSVSFATSPAQQQQQQKSPTAGRAPSPTRRSGSKPSVLDSAVAVTPSTMQGKAQGFGVTALPGSPTTRSRRTSSPTAHAASANQSSMLQESHGPVRAYLQQQQNKILTPAAGLGSPPSPSRQASNGLFPPVPPTPRSRSSSSSPSAQSRVVADQPSASAHMSAHFAGVSPAAKAAKSPVALVMGPPAVLTVKEHPVFWRRILNAVMVDYGYLVIISVFLLIAFDIMTGHGAQGGMVARNECVKIASKLSNTGEVVCEGEYYRLLA